MFTFANFLSSIQKNRVDVYKTLQETCLQSYSIQLNVLGTCVKLLSNEDAVKNNVN